MQSFRMTSGGQRVGIWDGRVPRPVAMELTGHKTNAVYRWYAIVCEADLSEGLKKLARLHEQCGAP
ncbi:MAG TPA: hypothetical protein VJ746_14590, partial [Nitrospira sp.]|nr:hypothetical protein [Nitrospira sp.]